MLRSLGEPLESDGGDNSVTILYCDESRSVDLGCVVVMVG